MTEQIDPATTALLMIDAQEEYFISGGVNELPAGPAALTRAADLLAGARAAGAHVVHIRHINGHPMSEEFLAGTPAIEIRPEVAPTGAEPVIDKAVPSAFAGTNLADVLREQGVRTLVIAGFMTQMCCTATAHEAVSRGYRTVFCSDATAAQDYGPTPAAEVHQRALDQQKALGADVQPVDAVLAALGASG